MIGSGLEAGARGIDSERKSVAPDTWQPEM